MCAWSSLNIFMSICKGLYLGPYICKCTSVHIRAPAYVCASVCMCAVVFVFMQVRARFSMHVRGCFCVYAYTCIRVCVRALLCACARLCLCMYVRVCVRVRARVCAARVIVPIRSPGPARVADFALKMVSTLTLALTEP